MEKFQAQNEKLIEEQRTCTQQKLSLEQEQELKKDSEDLFKKFQEQIAKIASLDIEDEQVLKTILQKLVHGVEINADGSIKQISYNFTNPASIGA
jgi:site-specific DNA recombinase